MLPEITVHKPAGVLPKVAVRQRKVIDYQPSWLLLAVPAVLALRARRRKAAASQQTLSAPRSDAMSSTSGDAVYPTAATTSVQRRRTRQVIIIPLARLRRKPGAHLDLDEAARVGQVTTSTTSPA